MSRYCPGVVDLVAQPVLAPLTPAAIFLVATIDDGGEATVHDALGDISGLVRAIGFRDPTKRLSVVASIGSDAWDRLFSGPRPAELHPFIALTGPRHHAPSTPGDLLFHIRAESLDVCFELASQVVEAMAGAITVVDEVHGFKFFDNRDLMGFVDGTENPDGPLAMSATQIGAEDPDFAGGCYVHVQQYLHDLSAWKSLSVEEQETGDRPHQARGHRTGRRRETRQFAPGAQRDHRRRRQRTEDPAPQHAVRRGGQGASSARTTSATRERLGDRADAAQHVHR